MIKVISIEKVDYNSNVLAFATVSLPKIKMIIKNIAILKGKGSGWFVAMPTYKNRIDDEWQKVIQFEDLKTQNKFLKELRKAIDEYAKQTATGK